MQRRSTGRILSNQINQQTEELNGDLEESVQKHELELFLDQEMNQPQQRNLFTQSQKGVLVGMNQSRLNDSTVLWGGNTPDITPSPTSGHPRLKPGRSTALSQNLDL